MAYSPAVRFEGAVVLITGASAGIGAAVAAQLAGRGARVLAAGRDPAATAAVAERTGAHPLLADLGTPAGPDELAAAALAVHGRVDALIASAGAGWRGPLAEMPAGTLDELITLNLRAPILLARALLPGMLARGTGQLTLLASIAGLTGVASESVYAATKAGLVVFAESLRLEVAGSGVGVAVVSPGAVDTGFFARRGTPYDRGFPRPLDVRRVARAVVRATERDRDVVLPRWLGVAPKVRAVLPGTYRRLARRLG
jgi:short-subunit dehydrogenase